MDSIKEKISLLRFFISLLSTALLAMVGWLFVSFELLSFGKAFVCVVVIVIVAVAVAFLLMGCLKLIKTL